MEGSILWMECIQKIYKDEQEDWEKSNALTERFCRIQGNELFIPTAVTLPSHRNCAMPKMGNSMTLLKGVVTPAADVEKIWKVENQSHCHCIVIVAGKTSTVRSVAGARHITSSLSAVGSTWAHCCQDEITQSFNPFGGSNWTIFTL